MYYISIDRLFNKNEKTIMRGVHHFVSYFPKIGAKILNLLGESEKDFE